MHIEPVASEEKGSAKTVRSLHKIGEFFAAGFYEDPQTPPVVRIARGLRRHLEKGPLPPWTGDELYPAGPVSLMPSTNSIVQFSYSHSLVYNRHALQGVYQATEDCEVRESLKVVDSDLSTYYMVGSSIDPELSLGGRGFTHSIPNIGRILREGLGSYSTRIADRLETAANRGDPATVWFYRALQDVVGGIQALHSRLMEVVCETQDVDPLRKAALLAALQQVPFRPARSFYEAILAANLILYLDGCDSLGRFDRDLGRYYEGDLSNSMIDRSRALHLVKLLWKNMDSANAWNVVIGGSDEDGGPLYNELTLICLCYEVEPRHGARDAGGEREVLKKPRYLLGRTEGVQGPHSHLLPPGRHADPGQRGGSRGT